MQFNILHFDLIIGRLLTRSITIMFQLLRHARWYSGRDKTLKATSLIVHWCTEGKYEVPATSRWNYSLEAFKPQLQSPPAVESRVKIRKFQLPKKEFRGTIFCLSGISAFVGKSNKLHEWYLVYRIKRPKMPTLKGMCKSLLAPVTSKLRVT